MPFYKGHPNYNFTHTSETREKLRISKLGKKNPMFRIPAWNKGKKHLANEKNPAWKGNNVKPLCLHVWIRKHFVKIGKCEHCGLIKKTEWSNKNHKYDSRDRTDWQELCRSCHQSYDYKFLGRTKERKKPTA